MNIKQLNTGDWVRVSDSANAYQVTSVNEEHGYATVLINGESRIVMANRLERAHKESVHTDAVKELQAQMQRLSKRFDTIATEMCQLETRINSL
jgi:hypothetical protein